MRLLVVEDEQRLAAGLRKGLEAEGFAVDVVHTGTDGIWMARENPFDAIILDVMLPGANGYQVCRTLRSEGNWTPILMLTAKDGVWDEVEGLDTGADDYLIKPFAVGELLARVRAHLRRSATLPGSSGSTVEFGDVKVDLARRTVERSGQNLHVTPIEYRLLTHLAAHPHCVLTHRQLLQSVWGPGHAHDTHYLRVYMGQLRKKIEHDPAQPRHLVTETGIGYRFVP